MASRRRATVLIMVGVALVGLAALTRLWVVPALSKLPGDTDRTASYAGTMQNVDPATFQLGKAVPITADRRVQVTDSDGDVAVIKSTLTLHTPAGDTTDSHSFAVDRTDYTQAEPPAGKQVEDQRGGLTLSRPSHPGQAGFTVFDTVTRTAQPVQYTSTHVVNGRTVYDFVGDTTAPVDSPELLAQLRAGVATLAKVGDGSSLPKSLLRGLAASLPPAKADAMNALLDQLPEQVPLAFTSTNHLELSIDSQFGAPVSMAQTQAIDANIATGATLVPLATLSKVVVEETPASVRANADFLNSGAAKLGLIQTWLPLALLIVGLALIGLGLTRRRTRALPVAEPISSGMTQAVERDADLV